MRMSDWCSDVCSSDLVEVAAAVGELGGAVQLHGEVGDELLGEGHHVVVVAVRLVELEHRELGVVAGGEALVPEHPPDLEHPLEAADREALQVELGRDPQEEVEVERVVVGGERAGRSEEHTSELQSLMRTSYAVFFLKKKNNK